MAEGSGGKSVSNVMYLDEARRKRQQNQIHQDHCTGEDVQQGVQSGDGAVENSVAGAGPGAGEQTKARSGTDSSPVGQVATTTPDCTDGGADTRSVAGSGISRDGSKSASDSSAKTASDGQVKKRQRSFNREKVERIKAELARGEYKIDYFSVADKYIEHDRFA